MIFAQRAMSAALALVVLIALYQGFLRLPAVHPSLSRISKHAGQTCWLGSCDCPGRQAGSSSMPGSKAALIIETAVLPNLVSLILHFASVLGPDWTIHTYHGPDNVGLFDAPAIQRLIAQGQMHLSSLPADAVLTSAAGVSHFLTRAWIWEQLAPASHVLVFQSDSVLCANSHQRVEDFLEYDFVGAPIASEYGQGYNGGLSLRRRERMLDVVRTYNWSEHDTFEDQWFFDKLHRLEQQGDDLESSRLPSLDVASKFSTETVWHATPLGLHQPWRWWQGESLETLKAWCPEASLIHRGSRIN